MPARIPRPALRLADLPELRDLLLRLRTVRLRIVSRSMAPTLEPGDEILVEPATVDVLLPGDLLLFEHRRALLCHRLLDRSPECLVTRGDATTGDGERIGPDQVWGKVVEVRKRTGWGALQAGLRCRLAGLLRRGLTFLQASGPYRSVMRRVLAPMTSYHLGLAMGAFRHRWLRLDSPARPPHLPPAARPHLVIATCARRVAGQALLVQKAGAWRCDHLAVRLRYRGLGIETALDTWVRLLCEGPTQAGSRDHPDEVAGRPRSRRDW